MLDTILDIISYILMAAGAFFMFSGSLGILRMKDFFTRLHPAGVSDSFGAPLILLGAMVHYGFSLVTVKIFFLILLFLITSPTITHTLSQAEIASKLKTALKDKE